MEWGHVIGIIVGLFGSGFLIKGGQLIWKAAATITEIKKELERVTRAVENHLPSKIATLDKRFTTHLVIYHGADPKELED